MDRLSLRIGVGGGEMTSIDFGSVPRRSSSDLPVYVKNRSTHYTARDVVVSIDDATTAQAAQLLLSTDDGRTFTAEAAVGDLAPGTSSVRILLRRTSGSTAALGEQTCTLAARAGAWE